MEAEQNNQMKMMLPILGVVVIGILGFTLLRPTTPDENATPTPAITQQSNNPANTPSSETDPINTQAFKAGTYSEIGMYTSPGGEEELGVTLTLDESGLITDSQVEVKATRPISKTRQEDFESNYKESVIGKNISELSLGKISGSSLTPKGFNNALEKIKAEAAS